MTKSIIPALSVVLFLMPLKGHSQKNDLKLSHQRLLLEMSSAFVLAQKEFTIDFDSAMVETSRYNGINRLILIGEGFYDPPFPVRNTWPDDKNITQFKQRLKTTRENERARLSALIGASYLYEPGSNSNNLDSARQFLSIAKKTAQETGQQSVVYHTLMLLGKFYLKKHQYDSATVCFNQVIAPCMQSGNTAMAAKAWFYWALYHPFDNTSFIERIGYLQKADTLYRQLNDLEKQAACKYFIGGLLYMIGKMDESHESFSSSLRICEQAGFSYTQYPNYFLTLTWHKLGYDQSAMKSAVSAIKTAEATNDSLCYGDIYSAMGAINVSNRIRPGEDMYWFKKAYTEFKKFKNPGLYNLVQNMSSILNTQEQHKEALSLLLETMEKLPPRNPIHMQEMLMSLGLTYQSLGNYAMAEKNMLQAEQLEKQAELIRGDINKRFLYENLGAFYLNKKEYEKSRKYFNLALTAVENPKSPTEYVNIQESLFQIDSATGHYLSALKHYQEINRAEDSLFNLKARMELNELSIKYETEKKDNNIQLLTQQTALKEMQLKQSGTNIKIAIAGALLLLLLSGLLYNRYRLVQKNNQAIELKKEEIDQQNNTLAALVHEKDLLLEEKDILLEEKEWLVKEIHHRVKNNLQIVISLLNTQSRFLDSEEAVRALADSRHRMQAMSLIHQKLYQSDNVGYVDMPTYIHELTEYLETSFNNNKEIYYELMIDPLELDITQAIPIGLIVNEAITNAIKYAFVNKETGIIRVIMKPASLNQWSLEISDNGEGLPEHTDLTGSSSMGMRLIKGLVKQIGGQMEIGNENGAFIKINFNIDNNLKTIAADKQVAMTGKVS